MSWALECGNPFHDEWCRHISTGKVHLAEGIMASNLMPIHDKAHIAMAVRQMASYQGNIQEARRKIMERAREIGAEDIIPDNWNEDGTLSELYRSSSRAATTRLAVDPRGSSQA